MSTGRYIDLLKSWGFQSFLWTQFLGALNDNLYKMVVSMVAISLPAASGGGSSTLALIAAIFILPFLLFSGYAGHLADVFNKRSVLIATKSFEIVAMGLGIFALLSGRMEFLMAVLFLMALQSTFFSPAKYSILPEMLPDKDLSRANGLLEMSTFLAIILGTSVGGIIFAAWKGHMGWIGLVTFMIAVVGTLCSLGISRVPTSGAQKPFELNPWGEIATGVKRLYRQKNLWLTVWGITYFWFLGALLQLDLLLLGKHLMNLNENYIGLLITALAIGIGLGSLAAGRLSGDKVELGLVPLGSIGMGLFSLLLSYRVPSYAQAMTALVLLGFSAGFFIVPLNALIQQKTGAQEKGRLIATCNFLNTGGIILASGVLWAFSSFLHLGPDHTILIFGFFTLAMTVYLLTILPDFTIRFVLWLLTHTIYRIRIVGNQNCPFRGPALLVCNHMSQIDGFLVGACVQRFVRFMIYRPYYELKPFNWLFRLMKAIPVSGESRKDVVEGLERAREELRQGHVVCIFAEGAISRTGNLLPFKRGMEKILEGLDCPVIPVHLDRLWGSVFSFRDGRFFWKWPQRIPYPVTVSFGKPMPSTVKASDVHQAIMEMGTEAWTYRRNSRDLLPLRFLKTAKRHWFSFAMADSSGPSTGSGPPRAWSRGGKELTFGKALVGSLLLSHWVQKRRPDDAMVGIMLPASVAGALANVAVLLAGKVPVNINFTAGREAMASAVQQCGIKTILTSRLFLAKGKVEAMEGMVFLEEVMKEITPIQKLWTALRAFLLPAWVLQAIHRHGKKPDDLAAVIFSSGSTGVPKGVMLSHHNFLSDIEGLAQVFWLTKKDRIMGVLPFFHSFGFTGTLWMPLVCGFGAVYHPNPLDAKAIGEMVHKYGATILISTPTFCGAYMRQCSPEQFASLRYAIVGAEKVPEAIGKAFKEKYGLDLLEGYGCTEMAPVVAVNIPDVVDRSTLRTVRQTGFRPGTVGHPIPCVAAKVVDPDTGAPLPCGQEGLLLVKGPNRMIGYLGQPEKTAEVLRGDWYVTGDIASMDDEGFIRITDRLSRFSKIGGEMVPHIKIEKTINAILGEPCCVVTALPDEQKGERIVCLYAGAKLTPEELSSRLSQTGLPKLWVPKRENLFPIDALPLLGTGKVDLKKAKAIAVEKAASKG